MADQNAALIAAMQSVLVGAIDLAADEIQDVAQQNVQQYYDEFQPSRYERTYQFLNAPKRTAVTSGANGAECSVYIDMDAMNYADTKYPPDPGAQQVVDWAASGQHGMRGMQNGEPFWENTLEQIDTEDIVNRKFIAYAKAKGLQITAS